MKTFLSLILILILMLGLSVSAQQQATVLSELPSLFLSPGVSLHLISPEPIQYVDIADERMVGDLPVDNVLRLKFYSPDENAAYHSGKGQAAIVTVVGQTFMAQYAMYPDYGPNESSVVRQEIMPEHRQPLALDEFSLSTAELKAFALKVTRQKRTYRDVKTRNTGMVAWLNNIYASGDYVFVDVSFHNHTRLKYDVDAFRFRLKDKRITKATNVQDVELAPVCILYDNSSFQRNYRNVFVFRKFTFPGNKQFCVELSEKQISGRTIELAIDYNDFLHADTL